jgi:hypothetical protein
MRPELGRGRQIAATCLLRSPASLQTLQIESAGTSSI